jgi:hypothetical protein
MDNMGVGAEFPVVLAPMLDPPLVGRTDNKLV